MDVASPRADARLKRLGRAWRWAAALGLAAYTAHTIFDARLGLDDVFNRWLYNALILLGLFACVVRAVAVRRERGAWIALSIGVGLWALGEIFYDFVYSGSPPFPSAADAFYLGFYPGCYVALLLLVRSRISAFGKGLWVDGAAAAIAAAALGAAVLFEVVLDSTAGSTSVIVTNLAYPIGDILLLGAVIGILVLTAWKPDRTWALIGAGLAATAVADGIYLFQTATGSYAEGTILDAMWPASMLLLTASAWQPAKRTRVALEGRPLLATPLACGLAALGILVYDHFHTLNPLAIGLAGGAILAVMLRTGMTFRENTRILDVLRAHSITDALTGLGNRRRLVADLDRTLADGVRAEPRLLAIYDLDGFKLYNDSFGHPAGDALLARLAASFAAVVGPRGTCYRLGGDEFCVLAGITSDEADEFLSATAAALAERGDGFAVSSSFGAVFVPAEATAPSDALRLADQRLYSQKRGRPGRGSPHEVLLQALYEREPALRDHIEGVVECAAGVGRRMGLDGEAIEELKLAARLHDVGKLAIPDAVLLKPAPLDETEWSFMKKHPLIGERILSVAPAWQGVAAVVRATHERWDGEGYPDRRAGTEIPLAARIIAVCDAFDAMTSDRPYRAAVGPDEALAELRRCAGSQFDPAVVAAYEDVDVAQTRAPRADAA
ncbi:MAG TPA: diguanylate cyclase [Gaiellaceae bacterium]|nr:diguanylate cyclase [Gaiellaceae bacterium]